MSQEPTQYVVTPDCDLQPLIQLARWAVHAGGVLSTLQQIRDASPEFDKTIKLYMRDVLFPEDSNPYGLVEQVLWLANELLEVHLKVVD